MAIDISALMSSLWYWELAGYATLAAVAIGVAGDSVHELTAWFKWSLWWKAKGGVASALLLIAALAAELVTQVKTSSINEQIIAFMSDQEAETRKTAASLEKDAAEAREQTAKLERELQPRDIDSRKLSEMLAGVPSLKIETKYAEGSDTYWLALRLEGALGSAGWPIVGMPQPIIADDSLLCRVSPALQCMGGQLFGVTVLTRETPSKNETTTRDALMKALALSQRGWAPGAFGSEHNSVPPDAIRILVGPKP